MESTVDYRFVVDATDPHRAADIATAEYKRLGNDWSKSSIRNVQPLGAVYSIL